MEELAGGVFLARFVFFVAASVAFGTAFFPIYAWRSVADSDATWVRRVILAASVATLVGAIAWLGFSVVDFGADDIQGFLTTVETVLFETAFGMPWLLRLAAAAALLLAAALALPWAVIALLATLVLGCESWMGHAAVGGIGHHLSHLVHVLAAAAWLGGLPPLSRALVEGLRKAAASERVLSILLRFSAMGIVAVSLIAATGILNRLYVAGPQPRFDTEYDRLFATKAALFVGMVGVAVFNRFRLVPQLADAETRPGVLRIIWWTVSLEQGLGIVLLLVATMLGMISPPS